MKLRNIILATIGILLSLFFLWGTLNGIYPKAKLFSGLIAISNTVKGPIVGFFAYTPMQYRYYEVLKTVSEKELVKLLDSKSEAVRCYAYKALAEKNYPDLFEILVTRLNDTSYVKSQDYDIVFGYKVSDYFIFNSDLTIRQQEIVDSILIFSNIGLINREIALERLKPKDSFYKRIRELAINNEPAAFIALAKYEKCEDLEILQSALTKEPTLYYGLWAIREFPHKKLLKGIIEVYNQEIQYETGFDHTVIRILYQALVQFNSEEVRFILESVVGNYNATNGRLKTEINANGDTIHTQKKSESLFELTYKYHAEYLWLALQKYETCYDYLKDSIEIESWWKDDILRQIDIE